MPSHPRRARTTNWSKSCLRLRAATSTRLRTLRNGMSNLMTFLLFLCAARSTSIFATDLLPWYSAKLIYC